MGSTSNPEVEPKRFTRRVGLAAGVAGVLTAVTAKIAEAQEATSLRLPTMGDPEALAEPVTSEPADTSGTETTAEVRAFKDSYELSWVDPLEIGPDGKPVKRTFTVINPLAGNRGFMVDFDKKIALEENDANYQTIIDPATGQPKMRNTTVGEEIKRLMNLYHAAEFIMQPGDPNALPATNFATFWMEAPDAPTGKVPFFHEQVFIKPADHPNGIVSTYWVVDNSHTVTDETRDTFYANRAAILGGTFYFYKSAEAGDQFIPGNFPTNTPERSRLTGLLNLRTRPIDLVA